LSCEGGPQLAAASDPANQPFPGDVPSAGRRRRKLEAMFSAAGNPMHDGALNGITAIDVFATIDFKKYVPENGAVYPDTPFGLGMKRIATMIKANAGLELFTIDIDGWDTHINQGPVDGTLHTMLTDLCDTL